MSARDPLWRRYLRFFRADPQADVDDELRFHIEELVRRYHAQGMDDQAAMRAAREQFGDVDGVRRAMSDHLARRLRRAERAGWLERVRNDVRIGTRNLLRQPGFTVAAVATLALGIGANAAVFSVVNSALLRPLPYPRAGSIVRIDEIVRGHPFSVSAPNFTDLRAQAHAFAGMAAFNDFPRTLTGFGDAQPVQAAAVTQDFFDVMGVLPLKGRAFSPSEETAGQTHVTILSDAIWRNTLGARDDIIGQSLQLDGETFTVVGIMPPGFDYPSATRLWTPQAFTSDELITQRGAHYLTVVARLRTGVALASATSEVEAIAARLAQAYPNTNKGNGAVVRTLRDDLVGETPRRALLVLLGAVALVALIASANVANLLLARGAARQREMAVRTALGARPRDLISFALIESLLLAMLGGTAGLLVAWWATHTLDTLRPPDLRLLGAAKVDPVVLGFTFALSVVTGLLFGVAPALQASRAANVHGTLKAGGRGQMIGKEGWRVRGGLVAAELALAVILLAGAGLLIRSFGQLQRVDPGFDAGGVLTFQLSLPDARYPKAEQAELLYQRLLDRMAAVAGVRSVAAINGLPLDDYGYSISTHSLDGKLIEASQQPSTQIRFATPGLFSTLGMRLVSGRAFTSGDREGAPNVVVLNESAAKLLFDGQNPLGHALDISTTLGGRGRLGGEVIGVAKDIHDVSLSTPPRATIYLSHAQFPATDMAIVARAASGVDPLSLVKAVRGQLRELDPGLPMSEVRTMNRVTQLSVAQPRFAMMLLSFALVALTLAAVGIFGVMSFMVGQRTREIGVRMALGASGGAVVGETLRRAMIPVAIGVAVGVGGALALSRTMAGLLFEVKPGDPTILGAVAIGLALIAVGSAWLPARRASRVDPVVALSSE